MTPRIPYRTAKESRTLWDLCRQYDCAANGGELVFVTESTSDLVDWNTCSVLRWELPPQEDGPGAASTAPTLDGSPQEAPAVDHDSECVNPAQVQAVR